MSKSQVKRSNNFAASEQALLLALVIYLFYYMALVKQYAVQIECKKSDTNTNAIKNKAWAQVCREFNAQSRNLIYRDVEVLKNKYNNVKKRAKKRFAEEDRYVYGTGGGPSVPVEVTKQDLDIKEIIGAQMTGLPSECDDDFIGIVSENDNGKINFNDDNLPPDVENIKLVMDGEEDSDIGVSPTPGTIDCRNRNNMNIEYVLSDEEIIHEEEPVMNKGTQWTKCTPAMLKKPVSAQLKPAGAAASTPKCTSQKNPLRSKLSLWAASKQELAALQIECFKKEHELKLKHMQEKHDEFLKLQREEFQLKFHLMKCAAQKELPCSDRNQ